jgi:hypothetical protein
VILCKNKAQERSMPGDANPLEHEEIESVVIARNRVRKMTVYE